MPTYPLIAKVKKIVVDTVTLNVKADSELEAFYIAEKALAKFPEEHDEEGISYCYVENRETLDTEILEIMENVIEET